MWEKLKDNFERGIEQIKWFSSLLSDRLKIEYSVTKLLYKSEQMERKRGELMKKIGQRISELKGHSDSYIMKDRVIVEALNEIEKINSDIEAVKKEASEISKVEE